MPALIPVPKLEEFMLEQKKEWKDKNTVKVDHRIEPA